MIKGMKISVNGKEHECVADATLAAVASELQLPKKGVAVAVNNKMAPRAEWDTFFLHENDRLTIIKAACGG